MAHGSSTKNNATISSISFHKKTYGQNILLDDNASRASRHTSFDNGITFTNKQIKINERIHLKIIDVDETGQWLGSLTIGFTQIDPDLIQRQDLCKSSLPNLCRQSGISYMKRIVEKLTRQIILSFYYNQDGAFYVLDGKEQEIAKKINIDQPLWGVIDIYGNVKGVIFTTPPKIVDGSRTFFTKYDQKPDKLPIRYFTQLNSKDIQSVDFHNAHGPEIELFCQNKIVFRKNVHKLTRPYVFIDLPMTPNDELYIRILSIDLNYRTPGVLGFTNVNPSIFTTNFDSLPAGDPMGLLDRKEYWIINEDVFDERLNELDEYRFVYDKNGEIHMWRNNESICPTRTVACCDPNQTFYPFFYLNGRITALALFGLVSSTKTVHNTIKKEEKDDDAGLCQLCLDAPATCVLIPCGHVFFCSNCKDLFEQKSPGHHCPNCRKEYTNIFEIAAD